METIYKTRDHFKNQLGHEIVNVQNSHAKVRRLREQLIYAEQELRKHKDAREDWKAKLETVSCLISDIEFIPDTLEEDVDVVDAAAKQAVKLVESIEGVLDNESKPESTEDS